MVQLGMIKIGVVHLTHALLADVGCGVIDDVSRYLSIIAAAASPACCLLLLPSLPYARILVMHINENILIFIVLLEIYILAVEF